MHPEQMKREKSVEGEAKLDLRCWKPHLKAESDFSRTCLPYQDHPEFRNPVYKKNMAHSHKKTQDIAIKKIKAMGVWLS